MNGAASAPAAWSVAVALATLVLASAPESAQAQARGAIVGIVAGAAGTSQLWKPATPNSSHTGIVLGAFVDAATPRDGLSLRAEGTYTRRGGDAELDVSGVPAPGRLRADYISIGVHLKLSGSFGPLAAYVVLGPTLDQVLRSRLDPILGQLFREAKTPVFGATGGVGIEAWLSERVRVGLEARLTEGLSNAYDGDFTSVRNRSAEGLIRIGVPLSLLRDR